MATQTTDTNYFYSIERSGYLTVSSLFLDVLNDMTLGGAFEAINLSNNANAYPYVDHTLNNYSANIIQTSTKTVGTTLYLPGTTAVYPTGIHKPRPYVKVTAVIDSTGKVNYTSGASGNVYALSDVVNGDIGTTATDWPLFESATETTMLTPSTITTLQTSTDGGKTITPTSPPIGVHFTLGTKPTIFSFTVEATAVLDPLNSLRSNLVPNGDGQNDDGNNRQPWRIQFIIPDPQQAQGSVAAPLQMSYDPVASRVTIAKITDDAGTIMDNVGSLGAWQPGGVLDATDPKQGFINRKIRVADQTRTYPLSYMLSISNHGFFLGVWEGNWSTQRAGVSKASNYFNWVMVQRPVDRNSGRVLTTGKSPVFAVNGTDYLYYKSVVRESDILHPSIGPGPIDGDGYIQIAYAKPFKITGSKDSGGVSTAFTTTWEVGTTIYAPSTGTNANKYIGTVAKIVDDQTAYLSDHPDDAGPAGNPASRYAAPGDYRYLPPNQTPFRTYADRHSLDNHMLFSSTNQVALTEDKTYLLTFPHNLTTPRFRYTEELDMIGITSADVVRSGQDIQFVTYGEWGPRTYRALPSSSHDNTGVRIAALRAPTGPVWVGVQTVDGQAMGPTMANVGPYQFQGYPVSSIDRDANGAGGWTTTWVNVDPFPAGGNLSVLTDNSDPGGALTGDSVLYANRLFTPINLVAFPIQKVRSTDYAHHNNITYRVTRGGEQLSALGLAITTELCDATGAPFPAAVGQIGYIKDETGTPLYTSINPVPYGETTIINFTVTAINSALDGETPPGQNSKDFYFVYRV